MKLKLKIIRNIGDLSRCATIWNWFGFILSYFRFPERIEALSLFGSKSKSYPPSVKVKLLIFKFQVSKLPLFTSLKMNYIEFGFEQAFKSNNSLGKLNWKHNQFGNSIINLETDITLGKSTWKHHH